MIRIGALRDLNAWPLVDGLVDDVTVEMVHAPPSELARRLRDHELDLGLVPQVELQRQRDYRVVPDLCVSADGAVESILLFHRRPWDALYRIGVDTASNSSVELLRVLLWKRGRSDVELVPVTPGRDTLADPRFDAVLLIGDAALAADDGALPRLDLGTLWKQETDLPFVYALWIGWPHAHPVGTAAVAGAADRALPRRAELAGAFVRDEPGVLDAPAAERYLTRVIRYTLGAAERESLRVFHGLRQQAGLLPADLEWRLPFFEGDA